MWYKKYHMKKALMGSLCCFANRKCLQGEWWCDKSKASAGYNAWGAFSMVLKCHVLSTEETEMRLFVKSLFYFLMTSFQQGMQWKWAVTYNPYAFEMGDEDVLQLGMCILRNVRYKGWMKILLRRWD